MTTNENNALTTVETTTMPRHATDKYKMMIDCMDEGYCIIRMLYDKNGKATDWRYLEVNHAFELNNGLYNATGKTIREMAPDIEYKWVEIYDKVARSGEPIRFIEDSKALNRIFNLYAFRIGDPEERLVAVIFTDITLQAKAEEQLKLSKEKQAFMLKLTDSIRFVSDPAKIQFSAATLLGEHLGAARAGYAETQPDDSKVAVTLHYTDGVRGMEGVYSYEDYGMDLLNDLLAGKTVVRSDIANDPTLTKAEKQAHAVLDLGATLNIPLVKEGKLVAIMFVHFKNAHQWTENEIEIAEETAERTWATVERAKAEQALKESEAHYRALVEGHTQAVWETDPDGIIVAGSQSWMSYTGQTTAEFVGYGWLNAVHPDDREYAERQWREAVAAKRIVNAEFRIQFATGGYRWSNVRAVPVLDSEGKIQKWVGMNIDIQERKETEEELRQQRLQLSKVQEIGGVAGIDIDITDKLNGQRTPEYLRIHGLPGDTQNETHQDWLNRLHPEDRDKAAEALQTALEGKGNVYQNEYRIIRPSDRQVRWIYVKADIVRDSRGEAVRLIGAHIDITSQKESEMALWEAERKYREQLEKEVTDRTLQLNESKELIQATLDASFDMIQVFKAVRDKSGEIIDFIWILNNDVAASIYGDVIGQSLLERNPGVVETGIFAHFVEVTETGVPQRYEKYYQHEQFDGWIHQSVVKVDDGVATSTTDITERKLAEKQILGLNTMLSAKNRELEAMNSELTTFNNIAANDYNETFRALYLNLENLIKSDAARLSNTGKANLRKAQSAIQKMKMLTEDIVAFSKLPSIDGAVSEIDLNHTLNDVLDDFRDKINFTGITITAEDLPVINGFPLLTSLLFHHVIDNALKFRNEESPRLNISFTTVTKGTPPMPYFQITFADNGIGIPEEEQENIFNIFHTLHPKGTYRGSGIGLAVCRKIMALHKGYISALPNAGGGTIISCLFPA